MTNISDILEKAAELIEPEGAWCQKRSSLRSNGMFANYDNEEACRWCLIGAVWHIEGCTGGPADKFLRDHLGMPPGIWNDTPDRTQVEAVGKLREAAAKAKELGQ